MTTRSSQQPWFLSTLLGVIVAKGLGRREEPGEAALRSHKGGSVAVSVVVLFQGGFAFFIFFFFLLWRRISWDTSQNQWNSSANGCCVHQGWKRQAFVFTAHQGLSVLHRHWMGHPPADQERFLHNHNLFYRYNWCSGKNEIKIPTEDFLTLRWQATAD